MTNAEKVRSLPTPLARAAAELANAKAAESQANLRRLDAEQHVLALLGDMPAEGSTKSQTGEYVITVRTSINRTIDRDELCQIANLLPEAVGKRLFRWKPELDLKELRFLECNEPEIYAVAARAITAKPAKPSISVELVEG